MLTFNYHTHTKRCNHAVGTEREYVEFAIEHGIETLGFSDHAPYNFPFTDYYSGFRMRREELTEYAETVRALAKEYASDIRILCGFELEYYPDFHKDEMAFLQTIHPDYLILGQHYIGNEHPPIACTTLHDDIALTAYVTQALAGLATGDFLYQAHPDMSGWNFSRDVAEREYRRLCEGAKRMHIPLELNLLGVRGQRHYPSEAFFRIAAEVGNDVILGIDAHDPNSLYNPEAERIAREMVQRLGLKLIDKPLL